MTISTVIHFFCQSSLFLATGKLTTLQAIAIYSNSTKLVNFTALLQRSKKGKWSSIQLFNYVSAVILRMRIGEQFLLILIVLFLSYRTIRTIKISTHLSSFTVIIRECCSTLYVGLARAVSPTDTNFQLNFLLTQLQESLYEDLAV